MLERSTPSWIIVCATAGVIPTRTIWAPNNLVKHGCVLDHSGDRAGEPFEQRQIIWPAGLLQITLEDQGAQYVAVDQQR
jgi:hypothetical protein